MIVTFAMRVNVGPLVEHIVPTRNTVELASNRNEGMLWELLNTLLACTHTRACFSILLIVLAKYSVANTYSNR